MRLAFDRRLSADGLYLRFHPRRCGDAGQGTGGYLARRVHRRGGESRQGARTFACRRSPQAGGKPLRRSCAEVLEETGLHIHPERLRYVAESVSGHALQAVNFVFAASPIHAIDEDS